MVFRKVIGFLILSGCAGAGLGAKPAVIESALTYCDLHDYTPVSPPALRTPKIIAQYATAVELSRERVIAARNECDGKRAKLVNMIREKQ
jgi:hypothetical protein